MGDAPGGGWWRASFRRKLLLAFLLLGIVPTAIITFVALQYFTGLASLWQNPALATLIENAVRLGRHSLAPAQVDAAALARRLVGDPAISTALASGDIAAAVQVTTGQLASDAGGMGDNTPFALIRSPGGGDWRAVGPAPPAPPESQVPRIGTPEIDAAQGVVWCHLVEPDAEVIAGYRLGRETAASARVLDEGLPIFRSLGAYERLQLRTLGIVTASLFIVLVLASWIAARLLATSLAKPVLELEDATRRVAVGDYSHRVSARGSDELGRLVMAFNRMTADLQDRTEKLRRAERVAAWRDVARGLAHQIKNPLTPIRISAHRLRSLPHPPGSRERELLDDCLVALQHEVSNLERIADEFARFARLPEPRPEPVDVVPLAREVAELYVGGHPGVHLHFETAPGTGMMSLDPDLTRQVISNLVKNAVEAMPAGGDLTVRVEPLSRGALNGGVRILVRDTGHGIPPEVRERLFTPYLTTKTGGTGLGLALSHRMVADQGGTLEVLTGSGAGTTFQVDFPAARKDRSET